MRVKLEQVARVQRRQGCRRAQARRSQQESRRSSYQMSESCTVQPTAHKPQSRSESEKSRPWVGSFLRVGDTGIEPVTSSVSGPQGPQLP